MSCRIWPSGASVRKTSGHYSTTARFSAQSSRGDVHVSRTCRPPNAVPKELHSTTIIVTTAAPEVDITLSLAERENQLIGFFEYSTDLFHRDTIERMACHFRTLLEAIVADPDQPIATLPILTHAERHQILVEWNDTAADYPKDKCIHRLFEEQVERTPDAVALEFEENKSHTRSLIGERTS